ncbi:MAG: twin-arginine translocase subunit TatA [Gammaproteobacteria bacterium]|nr:twin-arginine translocase subunit TatA [Gammaproteobacteria bacterium]HSH29784.1 Sec-independent protein translocase subunit TatA [Thiohalobacter sp.]
MGISVWQLLIILAIVLVLFGAKRLRNLGGDLGTAVKGFKQAVKEGDEQSGKEQLEDKAEEERTIEGESTREKDKV